MTNFLDHYRHSHKEHDDVVWGVQLSDDRLIYQNPEEEFPTWLLLKDFLEETPLDIVRMWVQFREHIQELPQNREGYYYCKGAIAAPANPTFPHYVMGYLGGDTIYKSWYSTPALQITENYTEIIDFTNPPRGLILNGKAKNR